MPRVVIVSNRLPISVSRAEGKLVVARSSGGLATGLSTVHHEGGGSWIGWPGHSESLSPAERDSLAEQYEQHKVVAVDLSAEEVQRYYEDFCNGVLWPLFHYLIGQLPFEVEGFELYEAVNRRFADAVVARYQPGDLIWVHDYQLMLVPEMIRQALPEARIGYFHHIPFPASDVFRALPFRDRILHGLMGADLIGFHTSEYVRHFASSALRRLGVSIDVDRMRWEGRTVQVGPFPMGVDAAQIDRSARSAEVAAEVQAIRAPGSVRLLVGIDRLDYTKGIPRRLMAFERFLRDHPELREQVRLIQVAVPSRINVDAYQEFRDQVDGIIGRIHGEFATPTWVPIHYMFRNLPQHEIVALYRAADVMLVTPLRDGMNLVAKEFVAARGDEDGVLVLSEFAGAASELAEAIHVNPFDIAGLAETYHRALEMPLVERRTRMRALRRRVMRFDVQRWASLFLETLGQGGREAAAAEAGQHASGWMRDLVTRMREARPLVLLLDYDGTLIAYGATPVLSHPDPQLLSLLEALSARPYTEVHVLTGRHRQEIERWLGHLPIDLHAEHGLWVRPRGEQGRETIAVDASWKDRVLPILLDYADRTPGTEVEEKPAGLTWHYRNADPEFGAVQANEMRQHLTELLSNTPVEIVSSHKMIELRPHGVSKARSVAPLLERAAGGLLVAIGDGTTDEETFAALPPEAVSIRVGRGDTRAAFRVENVRNVRELLGHLLT
jgi:trehalose 6-phosphate synthase/phosphatase